MSRYAPDHKQATRERIVAAAGRRFKNSGVDGSGIAGVMADAGLTNGAFYAHFGSKDDLLAAVVSEQLAAQRDTIASLPDTPEALAGFVDDYLSRAHRDAPADGCPSAALLLDVSRAAEPIRAAYAAGLEAIIDVVATRLDPPDAAAARPKAVGLLALLVGALQLARALRDEANADEVLRAGRVQAAVLLGHPADTPGG
jgi:AcrR family transcriptional regulator